ncbi:MAG: hypothetical protein ABI024_15650 [Vicinamibacterales bacterium]
MNLRPRRRFAALLLAPVLATLAVGQPAAQSPPTSPTIGVLAVLTVKPDVQRADVMKVMSSEVRDTVKLYLDGKISQWFGKSDGRGVVFILNSTSVAEAKAITDGLPLIRDNLATFEFVALTPLTPLRMLLAEPPSAPKQ